jgi:hypothetical protein
MRSSGETLADKPENTRTPQLTIRAAPVAVPHRSRCLRTTPSVVLTGVLAAYADAARSASPSRT